MRASLADQLRPLVKEDNSTPKAVSKSGRVITIDELNQLDFVTDVAEDSKGNRIDGLVTAPILDCLPINTIKLDVSAYFRKLRWMLPDVNPPEVINNPKFFSAGFVYLTVEEFLELAKYQKEVNKVNLVFIWKARMPKDVYWSGILPVKVIGAERKKPVE